MRKGINFLRITLIVWLAISHIFSCCGDCDEEYDWPDLHPNTESKQITFNDRSWDFHSRWSNDGKKVGFARYNPNTRTLSLIVYDTESEEETVILSQNRGGDYCVSWSPDDKNIAIDNRDENDYSQVYIVNVETREVTKFTDNLRNTFRPAWSNDGKYIAYTENGHIYYKPVEGGNAIRINNVSGGWNPCWSPDDSKILFIKGETADDIYSINIDGSDLQLLASGNSLDFENWASWSNDGNSIMYQLYYSGISKVVMKNLTTGEITLLSEMEDCRFPDWSPDGSKAVFSCQDELWIITMNK